MSSNSFTWVTEGVDLGTAVVAVVPVAAAIDSLVWECKLAGPIPRDS